MPIERMHKHNIENKGEEIDIEYATQKQKVELISENVDKLTIRMDKTKQEIEDLNNQKKDIAENKYLVLL